MGEPKPEPCNPDSLKSFEFNVTINKTPGSVLGLELDLMDDVLAQVCGIDAGLIQSYNHTVKPELQVAVGDFIVEANGQSGDAKQLLEILRTEAQSVVLVRRPAEITVLVSKDEGLLGLELQKAPRGHSLLIHEVKDGLIQKWNLTNPDKELKPRDRIVAVNGNRANTAMMMKL